MKRKFKTDIVPWKNPNEFIKVYESAYSDDLAKNRWAVEQMTVWETRCWPSLPTAVEATLLFVRSKIQDQLYEASKTFFNAQEVEMMYSNAVVRFVNLLVEKDQNSKSKKRLAYLAAERNIPLWIVDIRHSATHGFHPTLPVLRMAYITIMTYLENIFWLPEKSRVCAMKKTVDETPMMELFQDYRIKQYQVIAESVKCREDIKKCADKIQTIADEIVVIPDSFGEKRQNIDTEARDKVLGKMDYLLNKPESRRKLINVLVRDFVTLDDIKTMISDDEIFMDTKTPASKISLATPFRQLYYPIIRLMHKHDLLSIFLEQLLLSQEKRELVILQKVVDYAAVYIIDLTQATNVSRDEAVPFICKGANLNKYRILYSCVRGCGAYVRVVFERLIFELQLQHWIQELSTMMEIKLGTALHELEGGNGVQKQKPKFDITFTVEDLEEDIFEEVDRNHLRKKGPWSLAPISIDWASTPIGHVFNPVDIAAEEDPDEDATNSGVIIGSRYACEESKPLITPQLEKFIFSERPQHSSMLYKRKREEI